VTLGAATTNLLPTTLFNGTLRYLELTIGGNDTLAPRQAIGSVPYSILSGGVQGGPVNASSIAQNGVAITNSAGRTIVTTDAGSRSVFGLFCGASAKTTTGVITDLGSGTAGYPATKVICETTCKSPTAHMCNGQELVASTELGLAVPSTSWYSTGAFSYLDTVAGANTERAYVNDCDGWTQTSPGNTFVGGFLGMIWSGSAPDNDWCAASYTIACCD
jgi:hypothetical protein